MDKLTITQGSLRGIIAQTVKANDETRLAERKFFLFSNRPVKVALNGSAVTIRLLIDIRYGTDIVRISEKIIEEIKKQLSETAGITVKGIEIIVKDVFYAQA